MESQPRADAARPRSQPTEEQRREEHGEPGEAWLGQQMTQREDGARDQQRRTDDRAEHAEAEAGRRRVVERRLQIPAEKCLFRQRDHQHLTRDVVPEARGQHEAEALPRMPVQRVALHEEREDHEREPERPEQRGRAFADEPTGRERRAFEETTQRKTVVHDALFVATHHEQIRRRQETEAHRGRRVLRRHEPRERGHHDRHRQRREERLGQPRGGRLLRARRWVGARERRGDLGHVACLARIIHGRQEHGAIAKRDSAGFSWLARRTQQRQVPPR